MNEAAFIAALRSVATHPAARGLADDAAVLGDLVLTHDMIVEGIHYLPDDPPEDVAWKLLAVNLSDLAAKGAEPMGVLLGYALGEDGWDRRFVAGLGEACRVLGAPLLGGDTVRMPPGNGRVLGLTALGRASQAPSRAGARAGDDLWVTGTIGDAGTGLELAKEGTRGPLVERYRRPTPRLAEGAALAPLVSAMCDVSDGVLIDSARVAAASGVAIVVDVGALPLSDALTALGGDDQERRLAAATAGDDYELLFTAPAARRDELERMSTPLTRIGHVEAGAGLSLLFAGKALPLPQRLGWEHG